MGAYSTILDVCFWPEHFKVAIWMTVRVYVGHRDNPKVLWPVFVLGSVQKRVPGIPYLAKNRYIPKPIDVYTTTAFRPRKEIMEHNGWNEQPIGTTPQLRHGGYRYHTAKEQHTGTSSCTAVYDDYTGLKKRPYSRHVVGIDASNSIITRMMECR